MTPQSPDTAKGGHRTLLLALVIFLGLPVLALGVLFVMSELRLNRTYDVQVAPLTVVASAETLARGQHLVQIVTGCSDCHSSDLSGQVWMDDPAVGRLVASNLTSGAGGIGGDYSPEDWLRFMRHGVDRNGKPLLLVSASSLDHLSDEDAAAMIAYIDSLPPVDNILPSTQVSLLGRGYMLLQPSFVPANIIDHESSLSSSAPPPGVTPEYGKYLVDSACVVCHQDDLGGGASPSAGRDLTKSGNLANWSERDFIRTMRTGFTPENYTLRSDLMPWKRLRHLSDDELKAIWLYLRGMPAVEAADS